MHFQIDDKLASYGSHYITKSDIEAVVSALSSETITGGKYVDEFEKEIAKTVGAKYAVACSSGTAALHLACIVLGIKQDDCVIVPTITFLATANAAIYCGAYVVFSDVNAENGLMQIEHLIEAVSRAPRKPTAVIIVDLAGQPAITKEIYDYCRENDIKIIIDACHSFGSVQFQEDRVNRVGENVYSDMTTFSFHPVKNITTGEGGAITTNSLEHYIELKKLRSHGINRDPEFMVNHSSAFSSNHEMNPWYYEVCQVGYNYRLTDFQAALGLSQLTKLKQFRNKRLALKIDYERYLLNYSKYVKKIQEVEDAESCWHLNIVLVEFEKLGCSRSWLMREMKAKGIGTQVHYIPVHLQPYYQRKFGYVNLLGAEEYYKKALSLPLHVHLTEVDVAYVVNTLMELLKIK